MSAEEVERSTLELSLQEQFQKIVPPEEGERIYFEALRHFTTSTDNPTWWWEHFRPEFPTSSQCRRDDRAHERIIEVVPDPDEKVWFIPEEDKHPYPVYFASPRVIQQILSNAYYFEYYLIDAKLKWLLCENHHGVMVALGEPVASKLRALK